MQKKLKSALSILLALVMVLGMIPMTVFADETTAVAEETTEIVEETIAVDDETAAVAELPDTMDGLSIAYPYNTETVQLTGTPVSRFQALTFESARNEVESAQLILTPDFDVNSFELTMNGLKNEKGNVIPGWAFEVYTQHYVTVTGSGNAANYSSSYNMYNPTYNKAGYDGTFPDALIPQDAAIAAGENTIASGNNQGIWVNLNVQDAAPGTYTGYATLTVNENTMQIPVSVRIYDVSITEEVHATNFIAVWWDMLQAEEGYLDRELADTYYDFLLTKRITPMDAWNVNRWDNTLADAAVEWAADPRITSYLITHQKGESGIFDAEAMKTTLTALINKQLEVGGSVDLFKKGFFYIYDEPRDDSEYAVSNNITAQLDAIKAELAPMLAQYPAIQNSFMDLKQVVTAPNPTDKTYSKVGNFWNYFINDDYGSTALTGDSYIYVPQFQWFQNSNQRALYASEEEVWWYGCCHPIAPYPTYHLNTPLVSARVESWMRYAYGIDGFMYSSVNMWGKYTDSGIDMFDVWNGYSGNGTPGDQILVYPGSEYGIKGPITSIRMENIREGQEDYEYLWQLENIYGSGISAYIQNMYSGVIPDTDASIHYNNRKALLTKLEQLNVAATGATEIEPGQECFVRGDAFESGVSKQIMVNATEPMVGLSLDYKITDGTDFGIALMSNWSSFYGYYYFNAEGTRTAYDGVAVQELDDGYLRVVFDMAALTILNGEPTADLEFLYLRGDNSHASGYVDNVQILTELPEWAVPSAPVEPEGPNEIFDGGSFTAGGGLTLDLDNEQSVNKMTFDYTIEGDGHFNIALMSDWSNWFGYFQFNANGATSDYAGVVTKKLDDGAIRVYVDLSAVTTVNKTPTDVLKILYIRGSSTTANGTISNICINGAAESAPRGKSLTPGTNQSVAVGAKEEIALLSFDYKVTGGEKISMALMPNWSSYYGYYDFNATGAVSSYVGVTTETLEDGYIRVTFDMAALTKQAGSPTAIIDFLFLNGGYCTADGYIDNVQYVLKKDMPRGTELTPGVNQSISVGAKENIVTLSFDYKVTGGEKISMALMPNWSSYYGYYEFNSTGALSPYAGVTTEALEDGYIRVTFDMAALTKLAGSPTAAIDFLFLNGGYCTANGYIDNVQYTTHVHNYDSVVTDPTCTTSGYTTYTCACGETYTANETDALGHHHEAVVTTPTCTTAGYTTYTCACGDTYTDNDVPALGHHYESVVTAPTAEAQGYTTHTCSTCGDSYVDSYTDYVPVETYLVLEKDMSVNLSLDKDLYLDLNGYNLNGTINTNGYKVYGIDTTTNKYSCDDMGYFNCVDKEGNAVVPESNHKSNVTGSIRRYMTIATENGYTFHRFYISITHKNLKPSTTGVGYKAVFYGDDMVKAQLDATSGYGFKLWLDGNNPVSAGKGRDSYESGRTITLRLNNFDVENYGETLVHATVWVKLTDGTYIETTQCSLTLKDMVETINDSYEAYSEEQLKGVRSMIERNPIMETWRVENLLGKEVIRGEAIEANVDKTILLNNNEALETVSFEYKVVDGDVFNLALMKDWSNFYSYYAFNASGATQNYAGVTTEKLEDGYIRVTIQVAALGQVTGNPDRVVDFLYIRGDWSDVNGYIDNVNYTVYKVNLNFEGAAFAAGTGATIELKGEKVNDLAVDRMTFDYTIEGDGYFHIALMQDWSNFFGYFKFDANGAVGTYAGVVTTKMSDGSVRVYVDMTKVAVVAGAPSNVLTMLYIRGGNDYVNCNGAISNICINDAAEPAPRGEPFVAGVSKAIDPENLGELEAISFEYKIVDGEKFNIALLPDWSNFYGYFAFGVDGANETYAGVTTEKLEDGYIRVTFDMASLTKVSGTPTAEIDFLYIRGSDWSNANGYIDNVQFVKKEISVDIEGRGRQIVSGEGLTWDMGAGTFSTVTMEYAITNGGTFAMAVCGSWSDFYGYYSFDQNGTVDSYAGISTEKLEDGYVRVTFDVAALNIASGTPTKDLKFLYISGSKNNANGYIDKVSVVDYREEVIRGEAFASGVNWAMDAEEEAVYGAVTFDYKITDDGKIAVALLDSAWKKYYGYFEFDKNGATRQYNGVTTTKRSDGYIYVTFDVDALTTISSSGEPEALGAIRIRGSASTANGYIDSVQFKESLNPTGVRFGVLSDVHLGSDDSTWASDHLKNALTVYKTRGVDAVVITGDLQQHYKDPYTVEDCKAWMENLADVWFEVFPNGINDLTGEPVEPILIYGNHDQLLVAEEYWPSRFGEYTDAYLKEVNGYYFVGAMYQRESAAAALVDYAEENSNGYPFFYMQHCPMIDILYGEDLNATDFETGMTMRDDLWNVSNAVTFSGHTHLPATDERSIYQPSDADDAQFTAIQVPSLNYARLSDLGYDVPGDASASKQGLYVVVEGSEVNVSRLSFADSNYPTGESIGADWVFDAADPADKPYGYETRANATNKPTFAADAKIEVLSNSGDSVAFRFPAATVTAPAGFSDQIQSYYIETVNVATGEVVNTKSFVTHYFMDAKEANFAGPYNMTVNGLAEETTYEIRVYAKEYYQVSSEPLTVQITTAKSVIRGTAMVAGESLQFTPDTTEKLAAISFDYKIVSGERFNIAFITHDWKNFYGYIACYASGYLGSDPGVSYKILEDGYVRVTVDLNKLTTVTGEPSDTVQLLYIRGDWSDANGYIDNIQYIIAEEEPEPVIRGKAFNVGANSYFYTECTDEMSRFSFEYRVTNDGVMDVLIGNDNGQYGNFYLSANGTVTGLSDTTAKNYAGVTTEVLADGYIRVTFLLDELNTVYRGTPGSVMSFIRVRATTTAAGYVDNVQWDVAQGDVIRGETFTAGSSKRIYFDEGVYSTVTFDYKITDGTEMQFAVLQDSAGSAYYGRFTLNATGEKTDYAGVEVQALSDGYYRVTINIAEVTVSSGTPTVLSTFYIRGSGTDASGYIDNLQVA